MGMSGFGEIELLGKISNPDISIITNIGESHLEFLHTKENVFKAKTELLPYTKEVLIINGDDDYLKNINESSLKTIKVLRKDSKNIEKSNFYYGNINFDEKGSSFSLEYSEKENEKFQKKLFKTNILGEHNILNLTMAIAVAKQFGIEDKDIEETVKNIKLTDMRFQITEKGNTIYINDAYNASPASMKKSLETFSEIYNDRMKIAVLGDMLELGENELELHSDTYETLRNIKLNKLYLFGERMKSLYDRVKKESQEKNSDENSEVEHFSDKNKIKEKLKEITDEKVILIKGSRGMKLEEIME